MANDLQSLTETASTPQVAPSSHAGGRPSKLTPDVVERLTEALGQGLTYQHACGRAGISYSTFRNWITAGEKADEAGDEDNEYLRFLMVVRQAEAEAVFCWMQQIEFAMVTDWRAAAWKAEHRYPQLYGRTIQDQRHSGQVQVNNQALALNIIDNPAASRAAAELLAAITAGVNQAEAESPL